MRPVLVGDVFSLAARLAQFPQADRHDHCLRLLQETEAADKYRKKLGRIHPLWGNGSLMGRVGCGAYSCASGPAFQSEEFCACVGEVLVCLQVWRAYKRSASAGLISQSLQEKGKSLPDFANCS